MPSDTKPVKVNTGIGEEGFRNCALCTAAALIGNGQTSGQVNLDLQKGLIPSECWGDRQEDKAFTTYRRKDPNAVRQTGDAVFDEVAHIDVPLSPPSDLEKMRDDLEKMHDDLAKAPKKSDDLDRDLSNQIVGDVPPRDFEKKFDDFPEDSFTKTPKKDDSTDRDLSDQIIGLAIYVKGKRNVKVACSENPFDFVERFGKSPDNLDDGTHPKTAIPFMNAQPDGTKFAVYTRARTEGPRPHWIYAEKTAGKVTFTDFQLDRDKLSEQVKSDLELPRDPPEAPTASESPLGPNGLIYANRPDISMFVLAFGSGVHK